MAKTTSTIAGNGQRRRMRTTSRERFAGGPALVAELMDASVTRASEHLAQPIKAFKLGIEFNTIRDLNRVEELTMSEQPNSKASPYGIVTGLLAGGLTAYFIFDYSGPYRWIAEAQMSIMGSFSQKLAFLLTFLVVWGVVALVALPLRKAFAGGAATTPPWATPRGGAGNDPTPVGYSPAGISTNSGTPVSPKKAGRFADFGLALLAMGVVLLFMGGRDYLRAASAGAKIEPATAAQFETGQPPASTWVRVTGVPVIDATISYGTSSSPDDYVPLASAAEGPFPNGVRLYAKLRPRTTPGEQIDGLVTKNDLPGPVRVRMEEMGLLKPGDHWVIDVGKDPARTQSTGQTLVMIGGGMTVLGLLMNIGRVRQWTRR
jgi:hypothetical protein